MGETDRLAILSIQEEIKRDRARERELRERRKQCELSCKPFIVTLLLILILTLLLILVIDFCC